MIGGMLSRRTGPRALMPDPTLPPPDLGSESLLRLPPSLETLLSEKRFLSAVVLLVRCNKALKKPELLEVGALADLRAWATAQEGVSLGFRVAYRARRRHLFGSSGEC